MKTKILITLIAIIIPSMLLAGESFVPTKVVTWWYHNNISTNIPPDLNNGKTWYASQDGGWHIEKWFDGHATPSKQYFIDNYAAASTWYKTWNATESGLEIFETDEGLLIRAWAKRVKQLNPQLNTPTAEQWLETFNELKEKQ